MVGMARNSICRALLVFVSVSVSVSASATARAGDTGVVRLENIEKKIFQLVNEAREDEGLKPLKWNVKLGEAASGHLAWMIVKKNLSHRFPEEGDLTTRIAATGLRFNASAENVAYATDWEELHPGLMRSPGHRANILNPNYDEVGIAVALGSNGYYAVEDFAHTTSESASPEAEARFAAAVRKKLRGGVVVAFSPKVCQAACEMGERDRLEAGRLSAEPGLRRVFAYTAAEPDEIPEPLLDALRAAGSGRLVVGICYKATETYPGGTYWVGVNH